MPTMYVKLFLEGHKNACHAAEAVRRQTMRFVPVMITKQPKLNAFQLVRGAGGIPAGVDD